MFHYTTLSLTSSVSFYITIPWIPVKQNMSISSLYGYCQHTLCKLEGLWSELFTRWNLQLCRETCPTCAIVTASLLSQRVLFTNRPANSHTNYQTTVLYPCSLHFANNCCFILRKTELYESIRNFQARWCSVFLYDQPSNILIQAI